MSHSHRKPKQIDELGQQEQYRCEATSATDVLLGISYQCSIRMIFVAGMGASEALYVSSYIRA